jgi:8-oxo-dGTP diphosphatase
MAMSPYIRALRAQVGHARLLMPSVAGIIRDGDGRILLVQVRDDDTWTTPGGAMDPDETPADAVVREVWEETGLVVDPTRVIAVYGGRTFVVRYPNGDETQYVTILFECSVQSGTLLTAGDGGDEIQAARFWSREDAMTLQLSAWLRDLLPHLYADHQEAWFQPPTRRPS